MFKFRPLLLRPHPPIFIEKTFPKLNIHMMPSFKLADDYDLDTVASIVTSGYKVLQSHFYVLTKDAVADTDHPYTTGLLRLQDRTEPEQIVIKDLRDTDFPSYKELEARRFPPAAFDDALFRLNPMRPPVETPSPVSKLQLNFVRGGLFLVWSLHHVYCDGVTISHWLSVWAEECRKLQGIEVTTSALPANIDELFKGRETVLQTLNRDTLPPHEVPFQYPPVSFPPGGTCGLLFAFSPKALSLLKEEADISKVTLPKPDSIKYLTTFTVVAAFLLRALARACLKAFPDGQEKWGDIFAMISGVEVRRFMDPPIHQLTGGCFVHVPAVSAPVEDVANKLSLADLALLHRQTTVTDKDQLKAAAAIAEHATEVTDVGMNNPYIHGITDWTRLGFYSSDFGPLLNHFSGPFRVPRSGQNRYLHILPNKAPDGGLEIMMTVDTAVASFLRQDSTFTNLAKELL